MDLFNVRNSKKNDKVYKKNPQTVARQQCSQMDYLLLKTLTKLPLNEFTTQVSCLGTWTMRPFEGGPDLLVMAT